MVTETGNGFHINIKTFKHPDNTLRLENHDLHVDVQVNGAYVVGPGCIHPNGKEYKQISSTNKIGRFDFREILKNLEKLNLKS